MKEMEARSHRIIGVMAIVIIRIATLGIQNSANPKPPSETEQTFDNRYKSTCFT
jgi:hypothetical protein